MLPTRRRARRYRRSYPQAGWGDRMLYIVEVPVTEDDLDERMNRMRAWLDHQRSEPSSFRLLRTDTQQVVRVVFKIESEAAAFASGFGGSLLSSPVPATAIA
jgi:hypothetical protein